MIHRANHKSNFTRIDNGLIRGTGLSDGAFRLMVFILSCSDDFEFSISGLASLLGMPKKKIMRLTNELKAAGYIKQKKRQDGRGHFGSYTWEVFEVPELPENRTSEKGNLGTELPENRTSAKPNFRFGAPIRTNNYKELSNSKNEMIEEKHKRSPAGVFQNVLLSDSELEDIDKIMGKVNRNRYIDLLSYYLKDHPEVHYPDHKKAIIRWYEKNKRAPITQLQDAKGEAE